ncbi:N-acetylmuramoyl-L-alanine amidase [Lentibacter algarum]|uniref:N-acetylmuramoyl-L-alanine amidase n=1 Tax=Lentibacter algarum TaxID=576131 RepID=UPI001C0A2B6F|nr:N-acetylmuramoyl-L-alanine amidase [Lentibacter algarum]MBU2982718.1 N-acetylmuramoyl-L-alanine amidase [Lentibacter algarum]
MNRFLVYILSALLLSAPHMNAQELSGLARFLPEGSAMKDRGRDVQLLLNLSQTVPYRVFTLDAPRRLVIDFREVDWGGAGAAKLDQSDRISEVRTGGFRPGWSRLVAELEAPMALKSVVMARQADTGQAQLSVVLQRTDADSFVATAGAPASGDWPVPKHTPKVKNEGRITIMLDPGHGGIDPGASHDGHEEKVLMLTFARELADELSRVPQVDVLLTREDDSFVSLERRVALAHQAGADLFISLHADALGQGHAHGATVHTLSDEATDEASALLAERHNRDDMLAGVDLSGQDDAVADILLDMARAETQPRTERLAAALVKGISDKGAPLNRRPHRSAAFSVLKAADIPSVLIEIGFLSSKRDFANIIDQAWRIEMAQALRDGIVAWMIEDEALSRVVRQ